MTSYERGYDLKDLSFRVNAGRFVGIVGPSGGGKTTIIDLLTRLQEPESGRIAVAGRDIRLMSLESLRNQIAVVSLDVFIWNAVVPLPECTTLRRWISSSRFRVEPIN